MASTPLPHPPPSLSLVPFSTFCAALRSLRSARSRGGKGAAAQRTTVAAEFRKSRGSATSSTGAAPDVSETKKDALTRFWKEARGKMAIAHQNQRTGAEADDKGAGSDELDDEEETFEPHTALSVDDTVILLSMFCPYLDEVHPLYMMKEKRVAEHYLDALGFPRYHRESAWLFNYRGGTSRPELSSYRNAVAKRAARDAQDGVFASVLCAVLTTRASPKSNPKLTIGRVWELLTTLCENAEAGGSLYRAHGMPKYGAEERGDVAARVNVKNKSGGLGGSDSESENSGIEEKVDPVLRAKKEAARKKDARIGVFREMLSFATATENAEFARLILKDVDVRLSSDLLLGWFHSDAKKYYDSAHDLRQLVKDVRKPGFSMANISIQPGSFASVALAARPTKSNLPNLARRLATGVSGKTSWIDDGGRDGYFYMEPKLDGERMQLHKLGNRVETFTRSKKNSTEVYGSLLQDVVCKAVNAKNAILDGEIMLWDESTNNWVGFESMRPVVYQMQNKKIGPGERYVLKFCIFDILYVSQASSAAEASQTESQLHLDSPSHPEVLGSVSVAPGPSTTAIIPKRQRRLPKSSNSLIQLPLWQRRELLNDIVQAKSSTADHVNGFRTSVEVVDVKIGRTEADLTDYLTEMVMSGYEGLVAKSPTASYGLAVRDPSRVIKLKPDYFEGGLQDIDVIILGGKYGSGQGVRKGRVGTLSSFLIGVRTHNSEEALVRYQSGADGCKWTPVGSVGTGYSVEELKMLQRKLAPFWRDVNPGGRDAFPDMWDVWDDGGEDESGRSLPPRPKQADTMFADVVKWIDPRDSVVLQVRAYELSRRKGYALRFPRCDRIRDPEEKPYYDVISLEELIEIDNVKIPPVIASSGGKDEDEVDAVFTDTSKKKRFRSKIAADTAYLKSQKTRIQQAPGSNLKVDQTRVATDVSGISAKDRSNVLTDFCFKVFATRLHDPEIKEDLERQIYRLGGMFNQSEGAEEVTHYLAVDSSCSQIQLIRTAAIERPEARICSRSIMRPAWLDECEDLGKAVPIERRHVFFASKSLERELLRHIDIYGDPWIERSTTVSFLACMTEMDSMKTRNELPSIKFSGKEDELVIEETVEKGMRGSGAIFWGLVGTSARHGSTLAPLEAAALLFRFFGGTFIENVDSNHARTSRGQLDIGAAQDNSSELISHILVGDAVLPESYDVVRKSITAPLALDCAFVSYAWVQACVDEKALVKAFV